MFMPNSGASKLASHLSALFNIYNTNSCSTFAILCPQPQDVVVYLSKSNQIGHIGPNVYIRRYQVR